jgi:hypothetical protein
MRVLRGERRRKQPAVSQDARPNHGMNLSSNCPGDCREPLRQVRPHQRDRATKIPVWDGLHL